MAVTTGKRTEAEQLEEKTPVEGIAAPGLAAVPQVATPVRELTFRAIASGMVIGSALSLCNIYSGLKIGWGFNMSITAALLAFGFFGLTRKATGAPQFGILENNINQTAASSAASISSAGLVAPIPALTMLTGETLSYPLLAIWCFSVCLVGITVAVGLRKQMIEVDKLPFPSGIASAQTLNEMYAKGKEAMTRVKTLVGSGILAAVLKVVESLVAIPKLAMPGAVSLASGAKASLYNLTFALEPSLLMIGVGGIIGFRAGASLLLGAVVGWGWLATVVIDNGWAKSGAADAMWSGPLLQWLLWPGVAMMVTASLTSFAFSWRSIWNGIRGAGKVKDAGAEKKDTGEVSRTWFLGGLAVALVASVLLQVVLFDIAVFVAALGVLLTFGLAVVAGRVSGETSITPVGAMGKVTQLMFGVIAPGQPAANLMSANVTGGAASQCADLLHDMKCGHILGATARLQAAAQLLGALGGAVVGSAAYLVLIPDPKNQLLTEEWPAPAAAAWKAVAEVFMKGIEAMPQGVVPAMAIAGAAGIVLAILEKVLPKGIRTWVPSPASLGLAFVIPAYYSIAMFLGGAISLVLGRVAPSWTARFLVIIASGLIAGESLAGVGVALQKMLFP